jgi:hypothetical protein
MKIDRFDVDVSGRQPGGMPDPRQQPQEQSPGDDRARGNAARSPQRPIDNEPPRRPRAGGDSNGLNVLV